MPAAEHADAAAEAQRQRPALREPLRDHAQQRRPVERLADAVDRDGARSTASTELVNVLVAEQVQAGRAERRAARTAGRSG